jgi:hypothetical protein
MVMESKTGFFRRAAVATVASFAIGGAVRAHAVDAVTSAPQDKPVSAYPKPLTPEQKAKQERRSIDFMNRAAKHAPTRDPDAASAPAPHHPAHATHHGKKKPAVEQVHKSSGPN